jgi:phosphatidylinositol-3-phosphatase
VAVPCGTVTEPPATYRHVIWIWMENHTWSQVLGDAKAAPYEVTLAARCATATHYRSVGSPSLPNYIAATSGATQGISDDLSPASHPLTVDNLFRQVRAAGGTERSYEEDMTAPCQQSPSGEYAVKHNPAAYYLGLTGQDRSACQADDVPLSNLTRDLDAGQLPSFAFVTPNLCHDTHDCPVSAGDAWLAAMVPPLLASPAYRSGTTAIFVIWDEEIPTANIVIAPAVRPGMIVTAPIDHFALLRTTEELLGLPDRLGAASTAPSLRPLFGL